MCAPFFKTSVGRAKLRGEKKFTNNPPFPAPPAPFENLIYVFIQVYNAGFFFCLARFVVIPLGALSCMLHVIKLKTFIFFAFPLFDASQFLSVCHRRNLIFVRGGAKTQRELRIKSRGGDLPLPWVRKF